MKQEQYSPIARSYALALSRAAQGQGLMPSVREEVQLVYNTLKQTPKLKLFLDNPRISEPEKKELLDRVFKDRLNPLLMTLLKLILIRRRTSYLTEILQLFMALSDEAEGLFAATVSSAAEIKEEDKQRLESVLEKFTHRRLKLNYLVEPKLIGGIIFRFRDLLIDFSLRSSIEELRSLLLGAPIAAAERK